MRNLLVIITIIIAAVGAAFLASMFHRDDTRLGMAGLGALIGANMIAMVCAALDQ